MRCGAILCLRRTHQAGIPQIATNVGLEARGGYTDLERAPQKSLGCLSLPSEAGAARGALQSRSRRAGSETLTHSRERNAPEAAALT